MGDFGRTGILERLERLDEDVDLMFDDDRRFRMVIVGGSALILLETITRATHDIDALDVSPAIQALLAKYDINTRVNTFIDHFPHNYDDRLVPICSGSRVDFYTASLEDIIISKLYSARDRDMEDIRDEKVLSAIDWDHLEHLATAEEEAQSSSMNQFRYKEFLDSYRNYVEECRPCENSLSEDFSLGM